MGDKDQCRFPHCRQPPVICLGFADNIRLCETHYQQHCDIELEDDPTIKQIVQHEKKMLRLHAKCGSAGAKRSLGKMERDLESYTLKSRLHQGKRVTVAEMREAIDKRAWAMLGQFFGEDDVKRGSYRADEDEAYDAFVEEHDVHPLRICKMLSFTRDGLNVEIVWEADEDDEEDDDEAEALDEEEEEEDDDDGDYFT